MHGVNQVLARSSVRQNGRLNTMHSMAAMAATAASKGDQQHFKRSRCQYPGHWGGVPFMDSMASDGLRASVVCGNTHLFYRLYSGLMSGTKRQ
ncbi:MAG: hypothetical protein ACLVAV_12795 [Clostridium sp.]